MSTDVVRHATANEPAAAARLAGQGADGLMSLLAEFHLAIADRAFRSTTSPARQLHDGISAAVYTGIGLGARAAGTAAGVALRRRRFTADGRPISARPTGNIAVGALNGLLGDRLAAEGNDLAVPLTFRFAGRDLPLDPEELATVLPGATEKLAVFVHGLCETDEVWRLGAAKRGGTYASRLTADLGYTCVHLRYNTGRHISENGRDLAAALERLHAAWPTAVDELSLIGHSMGGLVMRSAFHVGAGEEHGWLESVRHAIFLGSPHLGAPLERLVHRATRHMDAVGEARPLATFLRLRSAGIRDLRHGALLDEDWLDLDPESHDGPDPLDVELPATAEHFTVCGTVTRRPDHPVARVLGDLLVLEPSATGRGDGRGRCVPFKQEQGRHFGRVNHFQLVNHPDVYAQLRAWLGGDPC